jgi:hypothetical protein
MELFKDIQKKTKVKWWLYYLRRKDGSNFYLRYITIENLTSDYGIHIQV